MAIAARVSSKGQITLPKAVRVALGIGEGDDAVLTRTPDFLDLAGTIPVPEDRRDAAWDDVVRTARLARRYPGR